MNNIELWQGDCLELMKNIPDHTINMILCDLPYGTTVAKWDIIIPFESLWSQYLRISKENTPFLLFGSEPFTSLLIVSNLNMFKYRITWDKVAVTGHLNVNKMPMQQIEDICVFYKKKYKNNTSGKTGVYFNKNENKWKASFNNIYLGTFNTFEDASHARDLAEENQI